MMVRHSEASEQALFHKRRRGHLYISMFFFFSKKQQQHSDIDACCILQEGLTMSVKRLHIDEIPQIGMGSHRRIAFYKHKLCPNYVSHDLEIC